MKYSEQNLITTLAIGISRAQMYTAGHEAVDSAAAKLFTMLQDLPDEEVRIMVVEGEFVINHILFRESGLHGAKLIRMLKAKGVSRVDFLKGVDQGEIRSFLVDVADAEKEPDRYTRIRVGTMKVRLATHGLATQLDLSGFNDEQLGRLEAVYGNVSPFRELEVAGLEEIVANFLVSFRRGANVLKMISPVKSHSEYTYTHAMNVAVLSMSQAEYLGLNDDLVHAIGVAALMHDVGKLFVPRNVLHKDGKLSEEEFVTVKRHPLYGAAYLIKVEGIPPLAPIVALEHHRRYDGTGYPVLVDNGRRQHVASQIVAIADFFDALRSNRPYRRSLSTEEILYMMKKESAGFFNPLLLDNFSMILMRATS